MKSQYLPLLIITIITIFLSSCTFNSVTSPVATNLKYIMLFQNTKAEIVFDATLNVQADDTKYFDETNLDSRIYEETIRNKFNDYNISAGNERSRFKITISDISYSELYEDHQILIDENIDNYNYETLRSRELILTITMVILDRLTNKVKTYESIASESTHVRKKIIGRGHKESWVSHVSLESSLIYRAAKKSAGKAAGYLRKRKLKGDKDKLFE